MNELNIFENAEFGQVRTVTIEGEIWFVGKDVATALGYAKARNAISAHVLDEDKKDAPIQGTPGGTQTMTIINESGLYALILSSKLDSAKRFKHWATSEVLPAIRKHGMYAVDELLENPDIAIKAFTALKEERDKNKALQKDIQRMKPKEVFADAVSASHTSILIGDLAKLLKQNGYLHAGIADAFGGTGNRRDVGSRGATVRGGIFKLQRGREEAWMTKREKLAIIGKALDIEHGNNVFKANFMYTSDIELSITIEEPDKESLGFSVVKVFRFRTNRPLDMEEFLGYLEYMGSLPDLLENPS